MSVCLSICVSVYLSVCVAVYMITKKITKITKKDNGSIHLKHNVVYENSSDEFDIGHCLIKVKVTALL